MRHPIGAAILALLLASPHAGAAASPDTFATIDEWMASRMGDLDIPGAAVAIVDGDTIVHARGYGKADDDGRAVTPTTPFFVMSVTKSFTSFILLQLAEEGALRLDDPVAAHIPWFEVADARSRDITIRHLLTHTSGLPTLTPGEYDRVLEPPRADDLEREVRRLRETPLASAPGERFTYSNAGYATLGLLIETLEGRPYEDVLETRVFAPLGMAHAHARKADAEADGLAQGHRSWFGRPVAYDWDHSRIGVGAGFTYASVDDLARFAALQIGGGAWNGTRLLSREGIASLHAPATTVPSPEGDKSYALGWFVETIHGERLVHHPGAGPNFATNVLLLPDRGLAIVVTTNKNDPVDERPIALLGHGIASILLGHEPEIPPNGSALSHARSALVALDLALLAAAAWSALRLRARPRPRRAGRALVGGAFALLYALLALRIVPELVWPMRGLWLSVPDVALLLTVSGALGIALGALAATHAWRARRAAG